ncbi:MAG: hypothetical protein U5N85_02605 [Arcicella sp.]|nr:hypothetical protein [Arcicella sp.]
MLICILCEFQGVSQSSKSTLYFPNAFIYEVGRGNEKSELWIYHNPQKGQYLYVPNDDMVKAVLGSPNGIYKTYAQTEDGKKVIFTTKISKVLEKSKPNNRLKSINSNRRINASQGQILSKGFTLSYLKTNEIDTLFLSTQIKGNANVLYGFSMLDGDDKLPNSFALLGEVPNSQFLTEYVSKYSSVKLIAYESNPYQFDVKGYKSIK